MASSNDDLATFRVPRHRPVADTGRASTADQGGDRRSSAASEPPEARIDVEALAGKVYDLLIQELRLERERFGRPRL